MRRRDLLGIAVLAGAVAVAEAAELRVGQGQRLRLGVLLPVPGSDAFLTRLREGLRAAGWNEPELVIEVRQADGTVAAFTRLGENLASLPVDILVTASSAAAIALKAVTTQIPIVFVGTFDPVASGLVSSLDRPGGNLTGIAGFKAEIAAEWVALLQAIAPSATRIGLLSNPATLAPTALAAWKAVASSKAETDEVQINAPSEIEAVIERCSADRRVGLIVVPHTFPFANRKALVDAMAKFRVPAIYGIAEMVRTGGLISYGQNLGAQWRMAALYIDKIARGAAPSDLRVRYADQFDLTINRSAAAALGLTIPRGLLERATEVVQ